MSSTSEDPLFDGLNCLKNYIQKLNPNCEEFFQYKLFYSRSFCTKKVDPVRKRYAVPVTNCFYSCFAFPAL